MFIPPGREKFEVWSGSSSLEWPFFGSYMESKEAKHFELRLPLLNMGRADLCPGWSKLDIVPMLSLTKGIFRRSIAICEESFVLLVEVL